MKPDNDLAIPIFHKPVRLSLSDSLSLPAGSRLMSCAGVYIVDTPKTYICTLIYIYIYIRDIDTYTLYMLHILYYTYICTYYKCREM